MWESKAEPSPSDVTSCLVTSECWTTLLVTYNVLPPPPLPPLTPPHPDHWKTKPDRSGPSFLLVVLIWSSIRRCVLSPHLFSLLCVCVCLYVCRPWLILSTLMIWLYASSGFLSLCLLDCVWKKINNAKLLIYLTLIYWLTHVNCLK